MFFISLQFLMSIRHDFLTPIDFLYLFLLDRIEVVLEPEQFRQLQNHDLGSVDKFN